MWFKVKRFSPSDILVGTAQSGCCAFDAARAAHSAMDNRISLRDIQAILNKLGSRKFVRFQLLGQRVQVNIK